MVLGMPLIECTRGLLHFYIKGGAQIPVARHSFGVFISGGFVLVFFPPCLACFRHGSTPERKRCSGNS